MTIELQILILIGLLILSAFFSGSETALMSLTRAKVKSLVKQGKKNAKVLEKIKENPRRLIITILVGNNVVNTAGAALTTWIFAELFGSAAIAIATGIMTFFILVFGEITPKTYAAQNAEEISLRIAPTIHFLIILFYPFTRNFELISALISKILKSGETKELSEEELETIVTMGRKEGILEKEAAEMMHNVLKFGQTTAEEIMTPRQDMVLIDGELSLKDAIDYIVKTPYSRYPVYVGDEDKIAGIIDIDDVLAQLKAKKLSRKVKTMVRKVKFIPENKEIDDLLTEFEGKEVPMAMVVDEYGDIQGLVTVEDILEEIVGDIFDKSKIKELEGLKERSSGKKEVIIDAKTSIDEVNKIFGLGIKEGQYNTIGGYITDRLERVPFTGEEIKVRSATLEVTSATKQAVKKVKIKKK